MRSLRGWPNIRSGCTGPTTCLSGAGKLAGILVEVLPDGRHIIGIGLNSNNSVAEAPPELRASIATLLDLTGRNVDHTELLLALMENLEAALSHLAGPTELLGERFDLLCRQRGEILTVYQGEQSITGRCAGIAPDGALLLETPAGPRAIYSGTLKQKGDWSEQCCTLFSLRRHAHFLPVVVQLPRFHVAETPTANAIEIFRQALPRVSIRAISASAAGRGC